MTSFHPSDLLPPLTTLSAQLKSPHLSVAQVEPVWRFVPSPDWMIRKRVAEALDNMPTAQSQSALKYLSQDDNPQVAAAAKLAREQLAKLL